MVEKITRMIARLHISPLQFRVGPSVAYPILIQQYYYRDMAHHTAQFKTPPFSFGLQANEVHQISQIKTLPSSHQLPKIFPINFPSKIQAVSVVAPLRDAQDHLLPFQGLSLLQCQKITNFKAYKQLETFHTCIIKFQTQSALLHPRMSQFNFENYVKPGTYSLVPLSFIPSLSNYPCQQFILQHDHLLQEVTAVRGELAALRAELQAMKEQHKAFLLSSGGYESANGSRSKKIFKKDKICPIEGCNRKYSSRIAVNAHLRKFHGRRVQRQ